MRRMISVIARPIRGSPSSSSPAASRGQRFSSIRRRGAVWLEYGPAMMWNTRYGMMGESRFGGRSGMMTGMMGGSGADGMMSGGSRGDSTWAPSPATAKPSVSARQAEAIAARWLDRQGALRAGQADTFPGYYTIHALKGDRVAGMLSVNAYTGAVWYHWWHGSFRSMIE